MAAPSARWALRPRSPGPAGRTATAAPTRAGQARTAPAATVTARVRARTRRAAATPPSRRSSDRAPTPTRTQNEPRRPSHGWLHAARTAGGDGDLRHPGHARADGLHGTPAAGRVRRATPRADPRGAARGPADLPGP